MILLKTFSKRTLSLKVLRVKILSNTLITRLMIILTNILLIYSAFVYNAFMRIMKVILIVFFIIHHIKIKMLLILINYKKIHKIHYKRENYNEPIFFL